MLESIMYINSFGEIFEFGKNGVYVNENDLRNYEWSFDESNNNIFNITMGIAKKTIPIVVVKDTKEERNLIKSKMYELFDKDIAAGSCGKLYVGDYYLSCYIYGMDSTDYLAVDNILNASLKVVSQNGLWCKNDMFSFQYNSNNEEGTGYGYPHDYPHGYSFGSGHFGVVTNDSHTDSDIIISIYGYAQNPEIIIDGIIYKLNFTIDSGKYAVINTKERTIRLIDQTTGIVKNIFRYRDKTNYIFEKIPSGTHDVYWNSRFNFNIEVLLERGEPLWT